MVVARSYPRSKACAVATRDCYYPLRAEAPAIFATKKQKDHPGSYYLVPTPGRRILRLTRNLLHGPGVVPGFVVAKGFSGASTLLIRQTALVRRKWCSTCGSSVCTLERFACRGPLERLDEDRVEVVDELDQTDVEFINQPERTALEDVERGC